MSNCNNEVNSTLISSLGHSKYIYNSAFNHQPYHFLFPSIKLTSSKTLLHLRGNISSSCLRLSRASPSSLWPLGLLRSAAHKLLLAPEPPLVTGTGAVASYAQRINLTSNRDCCKGSCSWPGKASVSNPVATCDKNDSPLTNSNAASACDGGDAHMCSNQSPWVVNDNLAYGFAAVSAGGSESDTCCSCYQYASQRNLKYDHC